MNFFIWLQINTCVHCIQIHRFIRILRSFAKFFLNMPTKRQKVFNRVNIISLRCFFTANQEHKTKKRK